MMEMVDRSDALPLGPAPPRARRQDGDPQYDYDYQQDHYRHSPTTYLYSLKDPSHGPFPNGGWWGKCTAPTTHRHFSCCDELYLSRLSVASVFLPPCSAPRHGPHTARLHHRPSSHPTVTASSKASDTSSEVITSSSGPAA